MSSSWIADSTRFALYHRDHFTCVYCGTSSAEGAQLTLDHVVARSQGGDNRPTNLVTCCMRCNTARADRPIGRWLRFLFESGVPAEVVEAIPARLDVQTAIPLDRAEGRRLAKTAKDPAWGFSKYIK